MELFYFASFLSIIDGSANILSLLSAYGPLIMLFLYEWLLDTIDLVVYLLLAELILLSNKILSI